MLAVIETGGKQYHVKPGDVIKVDSLDGKLGDKVNFSNIVALYSNDKGSEIKIGEPFIKSANVKAEILKQGKDKKIIVFKKKRRQNYRRKKGHRQNITILRITNIEEK